MCTIGIPYEVDGQPSHSVGTPYKAYGPPTQTVGSPYRMSGQPRNIVGTPYKVYGLPMCTIGIPCKVYGPPTWTVGHPIGHMGHPHNIWDALSDTWATLWCIQDGSHVYGLPTARCLEATYSHGIQSTSMTLQMLIVMTTIYNGHRNITVCMMLTTCSGMQLGPYHILVLLLLLILECLCFGGMH